MVEGEEKKLNIGRLVKRRKLILDVTMRHCVLHGVTIKKNKSSTSFS